MQYITKSLLFLILCVWTLSGSAQTNYDYSVLQRETLGRGFVVIRKSTTQNFLTWRYLSSDPLHTSFNVYKEDKLMGNTTKNSYIDADYMYRNDATYRLVPVLDDQEQVEQAAIYTIKGNSPHGYLNIPLDPPTDEQFASEADFQYNANDASIGDVDGDGEYEIILKWDPSNSKDNAQSGKTGKVFIDCYKLDGTRLWRIDLGRNIRAGAHYTQFLVYDFDGDGKAELICKTADGTIDGMGNTIGDASQNYVNSSGFIITGPEYLTLFNGQTGAAMATVDYIPDRTPTNSWGKSSDNTNRVDRFLACVAYLDGVKPSAVMCRGYYGRTALTAWDWDGKNLTQKWAFDTRSNGLTTYEGQGNHNLRVGDVDGDGCDEIIYGQCAIDNDGTGLYTTRMGHGDAMRMTVFDPSSDNKLSVWGVHENKTDGSSFRDAATGKVLYQIKSSDDVGRGMAADIDPRYKGVEMWSSRSGGIISTDGKTVNTSTGGVSMNMAIWWEGTLLRNLQDGVNITRYNYETGGSSTVLSPSGCASNNSTKSNPCLVADIVGDWREELLVRTIDNKYLRLYINTDVIDYNFHTFLEEPVYRLSIAYQNVSYNQPTHVGFYFGHELGKMLESSYANESYILDAGMPYDGYEWIVDGQTVGTERNLTIPLSDIPVNSTKEVILKSLFRGYIFEEKITLNSTPSSLGEAWAGKLEIYQNPTENAVFINLPDNDSLINIEMYNTSGMNTYCNNVPGGTSLSIPMAEYPDGVYILKFTTHEFTIMRKIIK